ncbi:MAG TPA: efflux RND transporter permease subunit [Pseudomonadales bacterium]|nr:efflux RND transporter permease subunit [Pseudomonadales bacterium]
MIAWFAKNSVAANLLMAVIIMAGLLTIQTELELEVFPSAEPDRINVSVALRGATPEDVELGIATRIEEAVSDLEGIDTITSQSREGGTRVTIELEDGYDPRNLLDDIKGRVDAINGFPIDMEKPIISLAMRSFSVITVAVAGTQSEDEIAQFAERVREDLLGLDGISQVELDAVANYEIAIETSQDKLNQWNLTLDDISRAIRTNSLDISAGNLRSTGGDILLRSKGQAYRQGEFENIIVKTDDDGSVVRIRDVATVYDGFEEEGLSARFNGKRAAFIDVGRVGKQSALDVANKVKQYIADNQHKVPEGMTLSFWDDDSKILKDRLGILQSNAIQGTVLVLILLSLFLRPSVALWVFIGIPVSFLGAVAVMGAMDISLNVMSAFGFIVVLGIVVDDAIVTGENVYRHLKTSESGLDAAINGTQEVAIPVTFGVLTTIVAFLPIAFIEGRLGNIFMPIAAVVIPVMLFSLVESKFVLPAHLKNLQVNRSRKDGRFTRWQTNFAEGFENAIIKYYKPALDLSLKHRYTTLVSFIGLLVLIVAMLQSGWMRFTFWPPVEGDRGNVTLTMPVGTPFVVTDRHVEFITSKVVELQEKYRNPETGLSPILSIRSIAGSSGGRGSAPNVGRVSFEVIPQEQMVDDSLSTRVLVNELRKMVGEIAGAESLSYRSALWRTGSPIDVQFSANSMQTLNQVGDQVKQYLSQNPLVYEITDSLSDGKQELELTLTQQGEVLGFNRSDLVRQIGNAFRGAEAQRIQRGRNDVRVVVRLSQEERGRIDTLQNMLVRAPDGSNIPLSVVANLTPGKGPSVITRIDGMRVLNVRAEVDKSAVNMTVLKNDLTQHIDGLLMQYPDVRYTLEGEDKVRRESFGSMQSAIIMVLFAIYVLLALPLRSYSQPLIIMSVIPFGLIGAVLGHWITGYTLAFTSVLGMLALLGVLVNDSLVLVNYINQCQQKGMDLGQAVRTAGVSRFRAVALTSLTTFFGVLPLIMEKSISAQFLIPMALSLGFGILFATVITLFMVPTNVMIVNDIKNLLNRITRRPEAIDHRA